MHTDTMIYEVGKSAYVLGCNVSLYYTTLNFSFSTRNIEFKRKENKIDFLFYSSNLMILILELAIFFIGRVIEFKSS